jgi:hypothetical protein
MEPVTATVSVGASWMNVNMESSSSAVAQQPNPGQGRLIADGSRSHKIIHTHTR